MLALFPTVPLGHQVCATVGLPLRYAPTPGTVIARGPAAYQPEAKWQAVSAPTGVGVVHVERISVTAAERGAIDDIERIRILRPCGCSSQAAERRDDAAGGVVQVKEAANLIVDEQIVGIRRNGQHHAGNRSVLLGEGSWPGSSRPSARGASRSRESCPAWSMTMELGT